MNDYKNIKNNLLDLISEEKNRYNEYLRLCSEYQINPDPIATSTHIAIMKTLDLVRGIA